MNKREASMDQPVDASRAKVGAASHLRRVLPWVGAAIILGLIFYRIPRAAVWEAVAEVWLIAFIPLVLAEVLLVFWLEAEALVQLFSRLNTPVSSQEARSLRAVTYLLTPINWNLGTGAIVLRLRTAKRVPAIESTSSLVLYVHLDLLLLGSFVLVAVTSQPELSALGLLGGIAGGMVVVLAAGLILASTLLSKNGASSPSAGGMGGRGILRAYHLATWSDIAILLVFRTAFFVVLVLALWLEAKTFGLHIPLLYMAAAVPTILLVGSLPITPAGLGTQQAVILYLLAPYGTEAQLLAFGLVSPIAGKLAQFILGLLYMRGWSGSDLRPLPPG